MFPALFLSAPYLTRVISDLSGRTRAYGVNFIGLMLDRECLEIAAGNAPLVELFLAEPSREIVETIHAGGALASYQVASDQQALRAQDAGGVTGIVPAAEIVTELASRLIRPASTGTTPCSGTIRPWRQLGSPCHAATGGNPFLVRTLLSALAAGDPGVPVHPDRLPELGGGAIGRSVAQRLARLGQEAERLARAVAVLGTDVEPRHAYRLAGLGDDAGGAAEHALIGADLLAPRRPLEFVHPIVRTAVAQLLSPPERATRHLEAARMLGTEGLEAERLVPHLLAGDARADPWVVDTLRRAAARSVQFVTMRTVEVHLTHAYQKLGISSREKLPAALG